MWLVFLHGLPGCGKLTVARELQALTEFRLFHNHLAVRAEQSLIFTFAPERTVRSGFPEAAESAVRAEGGRTLLVGLRCDEPELERRMSDPSRRAFGKLSSAERYRELRDDGAFEFPPLRADLELDRASLSPAEAADRVHAHLLVTG